MKEENILKSYEIAKERYAALGVDTDKAIETLEQTPISLHCWQTDDVIGFETPDGVLSGGIQTTGNYPGRARNIGEVRQDIEKVKSLLAGKYRLNLHEIYGEFGGKKVDRDQVEVKHFQGWMDWAKENDLKLDFNSTSFSHPKSGSLSLANPDKGIRDFWIEHTKRCRAISEAIGKAQNDPCIMNIWIHDGSKDTTVEKLRYREILKSSLDEILAQKYDNMKDCLEAKLFGIGLESYTVGSWDFYCSYCAANKKIITIDTGHYQVGEDIADKVGSVLLFVPELMLHVSRPVHWDSDHVTTMNDDTLNLFKEIVRANALNRVHIGLDYFDASINRIGAYLVGTRSAQKCILSALLEPNKMLRNYEDNGKFFERLALLEEAKTLPMGAVYDYFNLKNNVPVGENYISSVDEYEKEVTSKRV
jgi:L-rhamnose isomerase